MSIEFEVRSVNGRPMAFFPKEPPPRDWLLSLFLEEVFPPSIMTYFQKAVSDAEMGISSTGNSGNIINVDIFPDRMTIEELFFDTEPKSTEISLSEAKQLLIDWQAALKIWRDGSS